MIINDKKWVIDNLKQTLDSALENFLNDGNKIQLLKLQKGKGYRYVSVYKLSYAYKLDWEGRWGKGKFKSLGSFYTTGTVHYRYVTKVIKVCGISTLRVILYKYLVGEGK